MRSTVSARARWFRSTLVGGLLAALMMLVFVAPAHASQIGPTDDRYPVTATTAFPYSAVVEIWYPTKGFGCTGWMYGPDMVATAGHCVYYKGAWSDLANAEVWAGRSGSTTPFPKCGVKSVGVPPQWTTSEDERFDYAALKLDCTVGYQTQWFSYGSQPTNPVGWKPRICGYPNDKPIHTMWCSDGQIEAADAYQLFYTNDTATRMSGGPVMGYSTTGWFAMGIHTRPRDGGTTTGVHDVYNHGTRITSTVSSNLYAWSTSP